MTLRAMGWTSSALLLALGAWGCSSSPSPAKAALAVTDIGPASNPPTGEACNLPAVQFGIYKTGGTAPSASSTGSLLTDGDSGASVNCTVSGGGSTFHFNGTLRHGTSSLSVNSGTVTKDSNNNFTGTAMLNLYSPTFSGTALSSPSGKPCSITAHGIASGRIWAAFDCSDLEHPPGTDCAVGGTLVFEDCN